MWPFQVASSFSAMLGAIRSSQVFFKMLGIALICSRHFLAILCGIGCPEQGMENGRRLFSCAHPRHADAV
jgi:hypothetical protein